jgi:YD repeat-containing protein
MGKVCAMSLIVLCAAVPQAQEPEQEAHPVADATGLQPNHEYFSQMPYEHIDQGTGALVLTFTDLILPGHGGRDLTFQRSYNSKGKRWTFGIAGYPLYIVEPGEHDAPTIFSADGGRHKTVSLQPVDRTSTQTIRATAGQLSTERFWRYVRDSHHILYLPDGTQCRYAHVGSTVGLANDGWLPGLKRLERCYPPSAGAAPTGEDISVAWEANAMTVTQRMPGQTRTVVVQLDGDNEYALPTSLTFMGQTWSYEWGDVARALAPTGLAWEYRIATTTFPWTVDVTAPQGGQVGYVLERKPLPHLELQAPYLNPVVVTKRWTLDRGATEPDEWTYQYGVDGYDAVIYTPTGARIGYQLEDSAHVTVREMSDQQGDPAHWVVRETERRTYQKLPFLTYGTTDEFGVKHVLRREIERDDRCYITDYGYDVVATNFANYHHSSSLVERTGASCGQTAVTRVVRRSYAHDDPEPKRLRLNVGHLTQEEIEVNGQVFTRSSDIAASTGVVNSQTVYGVTTTFNNFVGGQPGSATDANGKVTTFAYAWGMPSHIVTPAHRFEREFNPDGTVKAETEGAGSVNRRTTSYEYKDPLSRVTKITPPGQGRAATEIDYEFENAYTTKTTHGASWVKTIVDGFGRPIRTENSDGVSVTTTYDADGRKTFEGYPVRGSSTLGVKITYDVLGRVVERMNPPRGEEAAIVTFTYGPDTLTIRDEKGRDTIQHFQAFGSPDDVRLVGLTDATGKKWTYEYNAIGKLTKVIAPNNPDASPGPVREWVYNAKGWLERETHPESGIVTYAYTDGAREDKVGNVLARTDAKNQKITFDYDANNRLTKTTLPGGQEIQIFYEAGSDNRSETRVGTDVTKFFYDTAGRLIGQHASIDGREFDTRYLPDSRDNIRAITFPSMRTVMYDYDGEDRVTRVWDPLANTTYASEFAYHQSGAIEGYLAGNNIPFTFEYDQDRYWLTGIRSGPLDLTYADYDAVGNVGTIFDGRAGTWHQTLTYDNLDRLKTASGGYGSIAYDYDLHGNMTQQGADTFTYDPATLRLNGRTYDNNGSMTADSVGTYTYNARNQMETATVSGGLSTYKYDADEWRVTKTTPDGTKTYYLRGPNGQLLSELTVTAGGTESRREYIYAGARLIAVVER